MTELPLIVHIWALTSYLTFYSTTLSMINITTYVTNFKLCPIYSETLNKEYIGRIYQMSSSQFFNEFYSILRKFQCLRK